MSMRNSNIRVEDVSSRTKRDDCDRLSKIEREAILKDQVSSAEERLGEAKAILTSAKAAMRAHHKEKTNWWRICWTLVLFAGAYGATHSTQYWQWLISFSSVMFAAAELFEPRKDS